ncbi:MAG: 5'-nucleotidase C-terminal domain-containing protein [Flavobacteriales bacterium]|nr:5'-nucleotidase C-terminal domain-containing protein [Flavobacteriales bacterium]
MIRPGAYRHGLGIFLLLFLGGCKVLVPGERENSELIRLDANYVGRSEIVDRIIAPYKTSLNEVMSDTIGYTAQEFTKERPEGSLGNLATSLVWHRANELHPGIDIVLLNHGGFRAPLPKGAITSAHIFELMPFDNQLVILDLPRSALSELANLIARKGGDPICMRAGAYLELSGNSGRFVNLQPDGDSSLIQIATSDYLVNGGDDYGIFGQAQARYETTQLIRDILIQEFAVNYPSPDRAAEMKDEGRIRVKETER